MSVITPVHDGARHLRAAIDSVEAQGYRPLEVIVVDDGSTDETPRLIESLGERVRAFRQRNAGPAAARNRGLALARGELVAFCDADDTWPPGKLQLQVGRLLQDADLDVVLGRVQYMPDEGESLPDIQFEDPDEKTLTHVHLGSGVYRRRAFDRVGPFDETLRFSEDVDWFFRARELGLRIRILPEITLQYRIHAGNMTRGKTVTDFGITGVLKRSLDRRKASGKEGVNLAPWRDLDDAGATGSDPTGHPTVSVIVPVFNDTRYLDDAIDSALAQTHRALEILVVDDGSDPPVQLSRRAAGKVQVLRMAHRGQGAARNFAAARARGEVLAFLDADDVWLPDALEHQVGALVRDATVDMALGGMEEFVSPELAGISSPPADTRGRRGGLPSAFVVRTRAFRRVGGFREDVVIGEFIDWYSRAIDAGLREAQVEQIVVRRRIHDRNTGIVERDSRSQYAQVLKDALDRRRGVEHRPSDG